MAQDALIIDPKDNVATALRELKAGELILAGLGSPAIGLSQDIPFGHKFALRAIQQGDTIIKYGEVIGLASKRISKGEHVHVHNVEGLKGRGDRQ